MAEQRDQGPGWETGDFIRKGVWVMGAIKEDGGGAFAGCHGSHGTAAGGAAE